MAQQHVRKMTSSEQEAVRKKRQLTEADAPSWDRFPGAADNLPVLAAEPTPEQLEFFEQKIRPILANNCYACHTDSALGGLRLDTRDAMIRETASPAVRMSRK